jgi:succinoglycan biosynthesis transport protein ExoP
MNPKLRRRVKQVRRGWWVVVLIAAICTTGSVLISLCTPPTYVGESVLALTSPGRSPEQDAIVAVGYAKIFNQPATIERLRAGSGTPTDVEFEAQTVAASPILSIEASAGDPKTAQDAAQKMAEAFRDDISAVRQKGTQQAAADVQSQLDELLAQPQPPGTVNPTIGVLQERLDSMRFDTTNELQDLQLRAGVIEKTPKTWFNITVGAVGGLVVGILAAIGLSALSTRFKDSADVLDKTGIEPLVEVPGAGSARHDGTRDERVRALANIISLQDLTKAPVIALSDSRGAREARELTKGLAEMSAHQGYRTVLVYADQDPANATSMGLNDALVDSGLVPAVLQEAEDGHLMILQQGAFHAERSCLTRERMGAVLDELRTRADTIFMVAPPVADTIDSQIVCAAADLTMIMVAKGSTRTKDVNAAVTVLDKARAKFLGLVLVDGPNDN